MDTNDKNLCPICWEEFQNPKLLMCRHTFCEKCLQRFVASFDGKKTLACPMCRTVWDIPKGGVCRFMNNYFVDNHYIKTSEESIWKSCDICKKRTKMILKSCFHCCQNMCSLCTMSHEKALMFSGISVPNSETIYDLNLSEIEQDDEQSRSRNSSNVGVPFNLQLALDPIRSNQVVSLVSRFQIDTPRGVHQWHFINCMCPVSYNKCLVIPGAGPNICLYDITGKLEKTISTHGDQVRDIAYCQSDDSLLIAYLHSSIIWRYYDNNNMHFLFSTGNKNPYGIDLFPDDRIAVVCHGNGNGDYGVLQVYSNDGELLKNIDNHKGVKIFKRPYSVVVNRISSRIFVSDRGNNSVFVFSEEGNQVIHKYTGGKGVGTRLFRIENNFEPMNMAQDNDGNILVIDASNSTIHILNSEGSFLGLVITAARGAYGIALSIGVDPEGKIWIGDNNDGSVRIFRCISYLNTLETHSYLRDTQ